MAEPKGSSVCLKDIEVDQKDGLEDVLVDIFEDGDSPDRATGCDGAVEVDQVSPVNSPEVNDNDPRLEKFADVSAEEDDTDDLATRLQALPAHTLRSIIYDIAVTDETGELEAKLAQADAKKDFPSAVFGHQYCSVDSLVSFLDPENDQSASSSHKDEVEYVTHMVEELLLDISGETVSDSPYATKRAALVAMVKIFDVVFGYDGEGTWIARELPADVEVKWAGVFVEAFSTLTTFEKQRLATAKNGVFLEKLDSTVSSIARAGLGCAGQQ